MAKAKSNSKSIKQAVAVCFGLIYPQLTDAAAQSTENAARGTTRSKACVAGIATLRASIVDAAEYHAACVELFGNGLKKKGERIAGTLSEKLKADGVTAITSHTLLFQCRKVSGDWDKADVRKAAEESGLRAGYDATKPPKVETPKVEAKTAKVVTLPELIAEVTATLGGLATVAKMMESACIARKDSIRAQVCHDFAVKLTAAS
jgi:hypothetical protein